MNKQDELPDKNKSEDTIQNKDLFYPFAIILFMLSFSDLTGYLTLLSLVAATILEILEIDSESTQTIANLAINVIAQIGSIIIFVFLHNNKKVEPEEKSMPSGSHLITLLLVYSLLSAFTFCVAIFAAIFEELGFSFKSPYEAFEPTVELLGIPIFYVLFFCMYVIGASVSEELVFRRSFIPFLERRGLGTFWVLFFSSLLFSLMHTPQDLLFGSVGFTIIHFFGTFAGGMALGYIYMRTRKIIWPIILHGLNNGVAAVAQIGLVRSEQLDDYTIFSFYIFWVFTFLIVGVVTALVVIIQLILNRRSPSPPAWFRILTDMNIRSSRLLPVCLIALGFIGIEGGASIVFNLIFGLFGESNGNLLVLQYVIRVGYLVLLIGILAFFIFKKSGPLKEPDWVSDLTFPEATIPSYPYGYLTPAAEFQNFCGSCGREIVSNTQFCVYCGVKTTRSCSSCGREIIPNTQYCVYCGAKI